MSGGGEGVADDVGTLCSDLNVVSGFQLTVQHMIFFYVHEGCIMVSLGIAVSVTEDLQFVSLFATLTFLNSWKGFFSFLCVALFWSVLVSFFKILS